MREDAKQDVHAERKVEQEEAVLESDNEEGATHSPPKSASGVEETENSLGDFWTKTSAEMGLAPMSFIHSAFDVH